MPNNIITVKTLDGSYVPININEVTNVTLSSNKYAVVTTVRSAWTMSIEEGKKVQEAVNAPR